MSVQAISWALDHRVHSVTEKVILLVLANYANEYGISWPSQRTLAENAACDERTVRRTLVSLEARGVIRRIARRRGNGSRQSDMILMSAFTGRKPAPPGMLEDDEEPGDPVGAGQARVGDEAGDHVLVAVGIGCGGGVSVAGEVDLDGGCETARRRPVEERAR